MSSKETADALDRTIEAAGHETHVETYDNHGEWLPVSVWVTRGWGREAVLRSEAHNRKPDKQFGELFRIYISSDGNSGSKGVTVNDKMHGSVPSARPPTGLLALEDKKSDSSDSSDSSSSSSSRRKSKKSKKEKKDEKKRSKKEKKEKKSKKDKKSKKNKKN